MQQWKSSCCGTWRPLSQWTCTCGQAWTPEGVRQGTPCNSEAVGEVITRDADMRVKDLPPENVMLNKRGYSQRSDCGLTQRLDPQVKQTFPDSDMTSHVDSAAPELKPLVAAVDGRRLLPRQGHGRGGPAAPAYTL